MWGKSEREGGRKGKRESICHRDKFRRRERGDIVELGEQMKKCASHIEFKLCGLADSLSAASYFLVN